MSRRSKIFFSRSQGSTPLLIIPFIVAPDLQIPQERRPDLPSMSKLDQTDGSRKRKYSTASKQRSEDLWRYAKKRKTKLGYEQQVRASHSRRVYLAPNSPRSPTSSAYSNVIDGRETHTNYLQNVILRNFFFALDGLIFRMAFSYYGLTSSFRNCVFFLAVMLIWNLVSYRTDDPTTFSCNFLDTENSDTESSNKESSNTECSDTESSDTESSDTESSDTESSDTENSDTDSRVDDLVFDHLDLDDLDLSDSDYSESNVATQHYISAGGFHLYHADDSGSSFSNPYEEMLDSSSDDSDGGVSIRDFAYPSPGLGASIQGPSSAGSHPVDLSRLVGADILEGRIPLLAEAYGDLDSSGLKVSQTTASDTEDSDNEFLFCESPTDIDEYL